MSSSDLDITLSDAPDADGSASDDGARPAVPRRIGRYVVLERIGAGGMGVVFAAYDGQLDRVVAIKLLHPRARALNASARLVREAHALAQLSHPNVVSIYDAGTIDGQNFIAMELVLGRTLDAWLGETRRSWREILEVFAAAAAGLIAAHAAGIVHRDFKPANVLVGVDGRVRVLDFGLALGADDGSGERPVVVPPPCSSMLTAKLTAGGMVLGTPAYMAPEQRAGQVIDARADQYSFALALSEALFERGSTAPRWIRKVLARALERDPSARWPSMASLCSALSRRERRDGRVRATAACALLVGALAWRSASGDPSSACDDARAQTEALWDDAARADVHAGLLATGRGYAETTWSLVAPELDAYAEHAGVARQAVCEAQASAERDATVACLDHRVAAFSAVVAVLERADDTTLERAAAIVAGLPDLEVCGDPLALAVELPMPTDPGDRALAAEIRGGLLTVEALRSARRFAEGIGLARDLLAQSEGLGYAPVIAEAHLALGGILELIGDDRSAEQELTLAAMTARTQGQDRLATIAMSQLTGVVGYRLARVDEGRAWGRHAASMAARARPDAARRVQLLNNTGAVEYRAGEYVAAEAIYREAIAVVHTPESVGERQELANAHNNLGNVLARQGRLEEATAELELAVDNLRAVLGPEHPTVAMALINLGNASYDLGRFAEAGEFHRRALTVVQECFGEDHPLVGAAMGNLGLVMHRLGDDVEAGRLLEATIVLKRNVVGPDHPDVAFAMNNLGEVYRDLGRHEEALAQHDAAAAIWAANDGDHPYAAYPVANRGLDLLELGRADEALLALREAMTICARRPSDPSILAAAEFGLARAIVATAGDRDEALEHAHAALRTYREIGGRFELERTKIRAWLDEQG